MPVDCWEEVRPPEPETPPSLLSEGNVPHSEDEPFPYMDQNFEKLLPLVQQKAWTRMFQTQAGIFLTEVPFFLMTFAVSG